MYKVWYEAIIDAIDLTDEYDREIFGRSIVTFIAMYIGAFVVQISVLIAVVVFAFVFALLITDRDLGPPALWSFEGGFFTGALLYYDISPYIFGVVAGVCAFLLILSQYKAINRWISEHPRIPEIFKGWPVFIMSSLGGLSSYFLTLRYF